MNKPISAAQHARVVLKSHFENSTPRLRQYATFANPGESQADAIKRFMAARRREQRALEKRVFPKTAEALANTKAYVEAYYQLNMQLLRGAYADASHSTEDYVRDLFGDLSTNPTTWPETDEVKVEVEVCETCGC